MRSRCGLRHEEALLTQVQCRGEEYRMLRADVAGSSAREEFMALLVSTVNEFRSLLLDVG